MTDDADLPALDSVRRLDTPEATVLAQLSALFEDLQTVLRCCEWLMPRRRPAAATPDAGTPDAGRAQDAAASEAAALEATTPDGDPLLVEALWTTALLSYARCFAPRPGVSLTEADLTAAQPHGDVLAWHRALLLLRDHYAHVSVNPREAYAVGIAQDAAGAAEGIALTSARQPLVDLLTVRQTGAIAYTLSGVVDERIATRERALLDQVRSRTREDLDQLAPMAVTTA